MRTIFFLFVILMVIGACSKKKTADCPTTEKHFSFKENARIDTAHNSQVFFASVVSGNKLVFKYELSHTECPMVMDGDFAEYLIFEADPDATSFTYNTPDMQPQNVYYRLICGECSDAARNSVVADSGMITGTKLTSNSWQINFDVRAGNHGRKTGSGIFTRQ